jgi:hypothetical protein
MNKLIILMLILHLSSCQKKAAEDSLEDSSSTPQEKTNSIDSEKPKEKKSFSWKGTISFIQNELFISSAMASDDICLSECKTNKCATLILHHGKNNASELCQTDATSKYEFQFNKDPNVFFHNKLIEIKISDKNDLNFERSFIEVVDKKAKSEIKAISPNSTFVSLFLKDKIIDVIEENPTEAMNFYQTEGSYYSPEVIIGNLNAQLGLNLDSNNYLDHLEALEKINHINKEEINTIIEEKKNDDKLSDTRGQIEQFCNEVQTSLKADLNNMMPACYIHIKSFETYELVFWKPEIEIHDDCLIYQNNKYCSQNDKVKLIKNLTPKDLDNYLEADTYLEKIKYIIEEQKLNSLEEVIIEKELIESIDVIDESFLRYDSF